MGACLAVDEAALRSRHIDRQNKADYREEKRVVKLLLLGTGGSGKSTIVKQMKILHGGSGTYNPGLTHIDRVAAVDTCRSNALDSMGILLSACSRLGLSLGPGLEDAKARVQKATESGCGGKLYTSQLAEDIESLWADDCLQNVVTWTNEFQVSFSETLALVITTCVQLCDSAPYFLTNALRLAASDYLPTDEDILRARSITSGIVVVPFQVGITCIDFSLFDFLNRQRN